MEGCVELERKIEFLPAFDKRDPDPKKNYGIHGVEMRWYLKGELGVVQFVVYTNWQLPHVQKEQDTGLIGGDRFPHLLCRPMGADVGYHSPVPTYEGQEPMREECALLDGKPCYYDGSGLQAETVLQLLIEKGGEAVWDELESRYKTWLVDKA